MFACTVMCAGGGSAVTARRAASIQLHGCSFSGSGSGSGGGGNGRNEASIVLRQKSSLCAAHCTVRLRVCVL